MKDKKIDLQKLQKKRNYIKDVFSGKTKQAEIAGWVHDSRALGKIKFILVKDISGLIQVTAIKGQTPDKVFKMMDKIPRESSVYIKGKVVDSKQAPGGKEMNPEELVVFSKAEDLPIDVTDFSKTELPKRIDYRFLDLHRKPVQAIFKIEAAVLEGFREFMVKEEKAVEAVFPSIISASSEGGTELYKLKYFEKEAFLSQSCQLYKQMLACSMEKVFTLFTVWRAEKHNTTRHLNEARQLDYEQAFADEFVVMDVLARCIQYIISKLLKENKNDLELLGLKGKLKVPKTKYLTFEEAVKLLKKHKVVVEKHDLNVEGERKLGELFPDTIVFVHDWPIKGKPFYIMPKGKDLSGGFDAIYQGVEITSGGQRVHIPAILENQLKERNLNPKHFKSYIDSFRFGAPPHAGWGMGLERLVMLILGLSNIREVVLFPRDRDRLTP